MEITFKRVGDWYESLGDADHARAVAALIGTTPVRTRTEGVFTAGLPYHAIWMYRDTLQADGHSVTILDADGQPVS